MPPACRWIHSDDGSWLHWHYGCIGSVRLDGSFWLRGWATDRIEGRAASRDQAVRHITRMVTLRGLPWGAKKPVKRSRH